MATIPLYGRHGVVGYAIVDEEDYARLSRSRWGMQSNYKEDHYARRYIMQGGRVQAIQMHHEVLYLSYVKGERYKGNVVDHINHNGLDNRKNNLRIVTRGQNLQNKHACRNSTSAYRGVYWSKNRQKWAAEVKIHGKGFYLGLFCEEEEAARIAAEFRAKMMPYSQEALCGEK